MSRQVITIERVVRPMRGGSQAYLIQGSDRKFYVAKFVANPQGTRTLINEWISTQILKRFGITAPDQVVVRLEHSTKYAGSALTFKIGGREIPISPGLHLGSLCPVDPEKQAIYDFLPTNLIHKTANLDEFAKMLVLDVFLGQSDSRQAVFVRDRSRRELSFRGYFIDHGLLFGGREWELKDFASPSLYFDRKVYSMIATAVICEQTIEALASVSEDDLRAAVGDVPSEWFGPTDFAHLSPLLTTVHKRGERISALIAERLALLGIDTPQKLRKVRSLPLKVENKHPLKLDATPMVLPAAVVL